MLHSMLERESQARLGSTEVPFIVLGFKMAADPRKSTSYGPVAFSFRAGIFSRKGESNEGEIPALLESHMTYDRVKGVTNMAPLDKNRRNIKQSIK